MALNSGYEYCERLGRSARGATLLDYLRRRYRHSPADAWRNRIENGHVVLDGIPARPETPVREGQRLNWRRPPWHEPPAPTSFALLYRDSELLAVAKPAGLPVLPGGGFLQHTLLACVRRLDPAAVPMHRLGRWTSGLLLFARTRNARAAVAEAWRAGKVWKRYRALASGLPRRRAFVVTDRIGPVPHPLLGTVHATCFTGRASETRVQVVETADDRFVADVLPVTGRPHQIRIHLAAAGHPLVGDPLYVAGGLPSPDSRALPGDPGYQLHAAELRLPHPTRGKLLHLHCSPPPALRP